MHQHDPHAVDRRGAGRELGPSGRADGARAARLRALESRDALRSGRSDLAQPRPLRAVERPRVDAPLVDPAPHGRESGQPRVRSARAAVGVARRHRALPPAGQPRTRSSGVSPRVRRGDDDGSARAGHRDQRRDGDGAEVPRRALQPAGLHRLRLRHLRNLRRRMPHGRHRRGSGVARGPPRARQPVLDLRQQSHHDRRQHAHRVHGGRRRPVPRLPVERAARGRRQRPRADRARASRFQAHQAPPDADHPGHAHRLRLAASAGHRRGTRRAARCRGGEAHQARIRLAGGCAVPGAGRCVRAFRAGHRCAGCEGPRGLERPHGALSRRPSRACRGDRRDAEARASRRVGSQPADVRAPMRKASRAATRRTRC